MGQLGLSISSSRVAAVARALQWASLALVSLLSAEVSLFPILGVLLLGGQMLMGSGSSIIQDGSPLLPQAVQ